MEIGDRIRKARQERGLTVRELGALIGKSGSAVSLWESGGGITIDNRINLAAALDIPITDLIPMPKGADVQTCSAQEALLLDRFRAMSPRLREAYLRLLIAQSPPPDDAAP
jgi:transcriptional regulator with XRE-family HTH domain